MPEPAQRIAWIRATHADPALRDGDEAVRLAEQAVRASDGRSLSALDTLAAALAEVGRFEEAATRAREALELASSQGVSPRAEEIGRRLALYEQGRPYRDGR